VSKRQATPPAFVVCKAAPDSRVVWGVVEHPSDGSALDAVEHDAQQFVYALKDDAPTDVRPVESGIAPCDFTLGDTHVQKGQWWLGFHVEDEALWAELTNGLSPVALAKESAPTVSDATVSAATPINVNITFAEGALHHVTPVHVHVPEQQAPIVLNRIEHPAPRSVRVETNEDGTKRYVPEDS
jgi:hypothetical protein